MRPAGHIVMGGVASVLFYPFPSVTGLVFWITSVAADLDHYLNYLYHNGLTDLSLKKSMRYHEVLRGMWRRPEFLNLSVFHTVEFAAVVYACSSVTGWAWLEALFRGLVFHMVLDIIYLVRLKAFSLRAKSMIEYYVRKKRLLARGLVPGRLYAEAVRSVRAGDEKIIAEER